MEYNKSLSARIKRRNKCGFKGIGNHSPNNIRLMGDYTNPEENGKASTYAIETKRKAKLGFKRVIGINGLLYSVHKRALTKKFADNHQRMS